MSERNVLVDVSSSSSSSTNGPTSSDTSPNHANTSASYGATAPNGRGRASMQVNANADVEDPAKTVKNPVYGWDVSDTAARGYHIGFRASPWRLLFRDLRWVLAHIYMVPWLFLPLAYSKAPFHPLALAGSITMIILSLVITAAILVGAVTGIPPFLLVLAVLLLFIWVANKAQGKRTRLATSPDAVGVDKEVWFFANGVMTTGTGASDIADRLHVLFKRPIIAVLNQSYGLWFDLIECMLQRDLLLTTADIRVGYKTVRKAVLDTSKERIVIIAHSQGGIIASAWCDMLLTDVPTELLRRVEVYTFASAANHFSRPSLTPGGQYQAFAHVEHFANENDFVAQFGVLGYSPMPVAEPDGEDTDSNDAHGETELISHDATKLPYDPSKLSLKEKLVRALPVFEQWGAERGDKFPQAIGDYGGRIFLRTNHSGHLFADHYIHPDDSILDDPIVRKYSHLVTYLDGQNVKE